LTEIAIPDINPASPVTAKNSPNFTEHFDHLGDVFVWRLLKSYLALDSIISQSIIRRRSYAAMDRLGGQLLQSLKRVATIKRHTIILPVRL
jgi:hypothetical protein